MAVKPVHTPMVDLPAQGMTKENLPTTPAAPMLTLAGTQSAADNLSEAALGQATREEAKLPAPSLEIEPVCTRPDAAMNPVKSDIPTANTPVRTDAGNDKMMPLGAVVADGCCCFARRPVRFCPMDCLSSSVKQKGYILLKDGIW